MNDSHCTCTVCGAQFKKSPRKANLYCGLPCYRVAQRRGDYKRGTGLSFPCSHCGETVSGRSIGKDRDGSRSKNIFCDRDCYDAYRAEIKERELRSECIECGVSYLKQHVAAGKYCSMKCRTANKRAKPTHCVNCGTWFTAMQAIRRKNRTDFISVNGRKTCSDSCLSEWMSNNEDRKEKISKAFTGENHPNWQGGPQYKHRGARGAGWQRARRAALKRDGYKCLRCGVTNGEHMEATGKGLEVNHITPFWQFRGDNAKANALSNLESLCKSCHQKADWAWRKSNPVQFGLPMA